MIELKPCPFCGGEAELYVNGGVSARCKRCNCGTNYHDDSMVYVSKIKPAVERAIEEWNRRIDDIKTAPTVDAEPVRHGEWISVGKGFNWHYECSRCGYVDGYPFDDRHKHCPNCGAKMDGIGE